MTAAASRLFIHQGYSVLSLVALKLWQNEAEKISKNTSKSKSDFSTNKALPSVSALGYLGFG